MTIRDTRRTVLEIVNEVRKLVGLNTVTRLDADKHSLVALRLLNIVIADTSNYGDWQELIAVVSITASASVNTYSFGVTFPVKNIWEIAFANQRQALYPTDLADLQRLERGGGVGVPRRFSMRGVDAQGNPKIVVHPQPGSAEAGQEFKITYYKKPTLYDVSSADAVVSFPANVVIQGLYAKVLVEEAGGMMTPESTEAYRDYQRLMLEELNRYNADSGAGSGTQIVPTYTGRRS